MNSDKTGKGLRQAFLTALSLLLFSGICSAQPAGSLTIEECYQLAETNYPLVKQMALISQSKDYSLSSATTQFLPRVQISGQASYQSDVTSVPVNIPGISIPMPNKDQYRLFGEVNQPLTNAYAIKQQKALIRAKAETDSKQLEVNLYKLKERINQLYFGILLIDGQIGQIKLLKADIQQAIDRVNAAIDNGTALKSSLYELDAALLQADQKTAGLQGNRQAFVNMLSAFIHKQIDDRTQLTTPQHKAVAADVNRPELGLFSLQKHAVSLQTKLINAKNMPQASLFFQGGYGSPALNMLSNTFDPYYIGGIRFKWDISGLYSSKKEKQLVGIDQLSVDVRQDVFLFNTRLQMTRDTGDIATYKHLIDLDQQIIPLREKVHETSISQLDNGTITSTEHLKTLNDLNKAKQDLLLHRIQLLMAEYSYGTTSGN